MIHGIIQYFYLIFTRKYAFITNKKGRALHGSCLFSFYFLITA